MNGARKMGVVASKSLESADSGKLRADTTETLTHKLLILSDIRFLREALAEVLARSGAFEITGTTAHISHALAMSRTSPIQIIVIDAALPNGLAAARQLHDLPCVAHIVPLALSETEADVISWAEAGATGYIPRSVSLGDLALFLEEIVRGEQACSTRVAAGLMRWVSRASCANGQLPSPATPPQLTTREEQIVALIGAGFSNKEISRRLNIGLATTKSHVHNVLGKLELCRRGQVARWSRDSAVDVGRRTAPVTVLERHPHPPPPSTGRKMDTTPMQSRPD